MRENRSFALDAEDITRAIQMYIRDEYGAVVSDVTLHVNLELDKLREWAFQPRSTFSIDPMMFSAMAR